MNLVKIEINFTLQGIVFFVKYKWNIRKNSRLIYDYKYIIVFQKIAVSPLLLNQFRIWRYRFVARKKLEFWLFLLSTILKFIDNKFGVKINNFFFLAVQIFEVFSLEILVGLDSLDPLDNLVSLEDLAKYLRLEKISRPTKISRYSRNFGHSPDNYGSR